MICELWPIMVAIVIITFVVVVVVVIIIIINKNVSVQFILHKHLGMFWTGIDCIIIVWAFVVLWLFTLTILFQLIRKYEKFKWWWLPSLSMNIHHINKCYKYKLSNLKWFMISLYLTAIIIKQKPFRYT
jgi:hypothetical protein